MKRRLFYIATAISVIGWIALVAGWIQSYWRPAWEISFGKNSHGSEITVFSSHGQFGVDYFVSRFPKYFPTSTASFPEAPDPGGPSVGRVGIITTISVPGDPSTFGSSLLGYQFALQWFTASLMGFTQRDFFVNVPYILPILCASVPPAVVLVQIHTRRRSARRQLQNRCSKCNYDLRASPHRCPECGTAISKPWNAHRPTSRW